MAKLPKCSSKEAINTHNILLAKLRFTVSESHTNTNAQLSSEWLIDWMRTYGAMVVEILDDMVIVTQDIAAKQWSSSLKTAC